MKAFGVGCFNFGIRYKSPFIFETNSHVKNIETALKKIPAIDEISISHDEDLSYSIPISKAPDNLSNGENFPQISFLRVEFNIYIPARIQSDLLGEQGIHKLTKTEKFKVYFLDSYHGPVSFVECLDATHGCDPSSAVQVVREFLKSEFKKIDSEVDFECIGPSPFHVDFFIHPNENVTSKISTEEVHQKGYNIINFNYNKNLFENEEEVISYVFDEIEDELSLFYAIIRENILQMRSWGEIECKLHKLTEMEVNKNWISKIKNTYYSYHLRKTLINSLYKFKAGNELYKHNIDEWIYDVYGKSVNVYLKTYIESRSNRNSHYPVDAVCEWIKNIEDRSIKYFEISVSFSSAIIGGVIGSMITLIWGK